MAERIQQAERVVGEREQDSALREEEQEFLSKGAAAYLRDHKEHRRCAFCSHNAVTEIDHSEILVCIHCFHILADHVDEIKKFLNCA